MTVNNPAKWTAETPNLYTAVLSLSDGRNAPELLSQRVGFREIEILGREFRVNGVPIKLKGANRHESNVNTGHYVTEANMIEDIKLLKQANCNHVRTSHYSDDPRWYELCDEYGLYLVGEANVECHGNQGLSSEPRMEKMFVDRNVANVENFKNHPSILIWSLGNESGRGPNLRTAEMKVRSLDGTRPTHYEGFGIGDNNPAGIDSQMYTQPNPLAGIAQNNDLDKPMYLCEYAHAMFNSMGALGEYNDVFDQYPSLLGGAIWEWEDQGIWNRRDPKRQYIAYGGGFGEFPNDHYFIQRRGLLRQNAEAALPRSQARLPVDQVRAGRFGQGTNQSQEQICVHRLERVSRLLVGDRRRRDGAKREIARAEVGAGCRDDAGDSDESVRAQAGRDVSFERGDGDRPRRQLGAVGHRDGARKWNCRWRLRHRLSRWRR